MTYAEQARARSQLGRGAFDLTSFPRYLWHEPGRIHRLLVELGPCAASSAARSYSLSLLLAAFVIYLAVSFSLGLFQVPISLGGSLNLGQPLVLMSAAAVGVPALATSLAAFWALGLVFIALFTAGESNSERFKAVLWSIVLLLLYAGFAIGFAQSAIQ